MSNSTDSVVAKANKFVDNHNSVEDIFEGPEHDTILGKANYWLQWGLVGLFALFTLFYAIQKFNGTCRWEVLYVSAMAGFVNFVTILFSDYEPMT